MKNIQKPTLTTAVKLLKSRFWFLFTIKLLFQKLVFLFSRESISSKSWLENKVVFEKQKPKTILKTINNHPLNENILEHNETKWLKIKGKIA